MDNNSEIELQPDVSVVLQEEEPEEVPAVPVCVRDVHGPVRTQDLPRKAGATRTRSIGTTATQVLRADHYRAQTTLMSIDENIYIAFSTAAAQDTSSMSLWPKLVPFTTRAAVGVWVQAAQNTTSVSVTTENWAAGEV